MNKKQMRELIEQGMTQFTSNGGEIKKGKTSGSRNKPDKKEKVEYVEIEVSALPESLKKYVV